MGKLAGATEGYEFAQQVNDSSDDNTLQSASYKVMRKTKTRAPLFFKSGVTSWRSP